ncbi:hypothetical protein C7S15_7400 [Burkholderia cepacia]|nr:hypothetical protein [Burkholderia cepacia]
MTAPDFRVIRSCSNAARGEGIQQEACLLSFQMDFILNSLLV